MFNIHTKGIGNLRSMERRFRSAEVNLATAMSIEGQVAASQTEDRLSYMFPDESIHWVVAFEADSFDMSISIDASDDYGAYTLDLYSEEVSEAVGLEIADLSERISRAISGGSNA